MMQRPVPDIILAVDPGRQKCGIAVVHRQSGVKHKQIVSTDSLVETVKTLCEQHPVNVIVIGDRTRSQLTSSELAGLGLPIVFVNEDCSSMEGRQRYLRENTRGLARLLPLGLRVPAGAYDDYVAVILAERYWQTVSDE